MTGVGGRPEVIVEGSDDHDSGWKEYDFFYKPGKVGFRLPIVGKELWMSYLLCATRFKSSFVDFSRLLSLFMINLVNYSFFSFHFYIFFQ